MDIKAKIEEVLARIKDDKDFAAKFSNDPIKAIETVIGVDLPDDQIKALLKASMQKYLWTRQVTYLVHSKKYFNNRLSSVVALTVRNVTVNSIGIYC